MDYETLRQISDSWGLLYLVLIFFGVIAFTFRPGSKEQAERLARLPLDEDDNNVR
jgi:cytochrome c oxidase cbb3-type subunit 4